MSGRRVRDRGPAGWAEAREPGVTPPGPAGTPRRSGRRFTTWRRATQAAVAVAYVGLPFLAWERVTGTMVALRLGPLELAEPAAVASAILAGGVGALGLAVGVVPVVLLAAILGPVYCSWACPFGLASELVDRVRPRRTRWGKRSWEKARIPRWGALGLLLVGSVLLGIPLAAILSPPRLATVLPIEVLAGKVFPAATGILLAVALAVELLGPRRITCRALCPAGAVAAALRSRLTWGPRFEVAACRCPAAPICHERCPWGIDPRAMGLLDGCTSCMACVDDCPSGALSAGRMRGSGSASSHPTSEASA